MSPGQAYKLTIESATNETIRYYFYNNNKTFQSTYTEELSDGSMIISPTVNYYFFSFQFSSPSFVGKKIFFKPTNQIDSFYSVYASNRSKDNVENRDSVGYGSNLVSGNELIFGTRGTNGVFSNSATTVTIKNIIPIEVKRDYILHVDNAANKNVRFFYYSSLNESDLVYTTIVTLNANGEYFFTPIYNNTDIKGFCFHIGDSALINNSISLYLYPEKSMSLYKRTRTNEEQISQSFGRYVFEFVQGGLDSNGLNNNAIITNRIRQNGYTKVSGGHTYTIKQNGGTGLRVAVSYYTTNDYITSRINNSGWKTIPATITVPNDCQYIRMVVANSTDSNITPDVASVYMDIGIMQYVNEPIRNEITAQYQGEKVNVGNIYHGRIEHYLQKPTDMRCQGGDVWNNILVIGDSSNSGLKFFNFETGEYLGECSVANAPSTLHYNTAKFAPSLHTGNSQFPYLYASEFYGDGSIFAIEITESSGIYSASIVQEIIISSLTTATVGAGYADFVIDFTNNKLILIRYKMENVIDWTSGNYTYFTTFDLPDISNATITLTDNDINFVNIVTDIISIRQQSVFYNGKIYILSGYSLGEFWVVDYGENVSRYKSRASLVPVIGSNEPELLVIYNGCIYIASSTTNNIYKIWFD